MLVSQFYNSKYQKYCKSLFTFLVSVFMAFLAQKLIYTTNIWFHFVFDSRLLNLIILGVYSKIWPKCARISK